MRAILDAAASKQSDSDSVECSVLLMLTFLRAKSEEIALRYFTEVFQWRALEKHRCAACFRENPLRGFLSSLRGFQKPTEVFPENH